MLESDAILEKAASLKAAGKPFVLVTVVRCESPTSAKPGAKAVVEADGVIQGWIGGGCAQPAVIKMATQALQDGQPKLIRISPSKNANIEEGIMDFGMTCHSGGTLDIFIDPVIPRPVMLIVGASPAAQALSALAHRVGFSVTAAFPGADSDMFPDADRIIDGLALTEHLAGTPSFVIVATQGKRDEEGLEAALNTGSDFIAFIASERKADKLKNYLKERGHDAAKVDAILSPAGIEIGAVTPEEIALSVLAGVVKTRRDLADTESAPATSTTGALNEQSETEGSCCGTPQQAPASTAASCCGASVEGTSESIDPVCGMSVDPETAEYQAAYEGRRYYFCCAGCQHSFEKDPQQYLKK